MPCPPINFNEHFGNNIIMRRPLIKFLGPRKLLQNQSSQNVPVAASTASPASTPEVSPSSPPSASTTSSEFTDIPLSSMRKIIASRLTASKATVPHIYSSIDCEMNSLMSFRKQLNQAYQTKLSVNDFILKAAAQALVAVPEANMLWNDKTKSKESVADVDISVAVATEQGLITPIVPYVSEKGLVEINSTLSELVGRARSNKLKPHEFQGGSFTVSNLGGFGIDNFTAVINPPQACILAVGGARDVLDANDSTLPPKPIKKMNVTLSSDRRVVDEATAGQFLQAFQMFIQAPQLLVSI